MTDSEVAIPLATIQELAEKRAARANVAGTGNEWLEAENKIDKIGILVMPAIESTGEFLSELWNGHREWESPEGNIYSVGRDGRIIGYPPFIGYPPDISFGYVKTLNTGFKELSKSYLCKNGISDIHAFKAEWLGTNKNLKLFDVVKNTETHELLIVRKTTQEIIVNTKIIAQ